jgi:hypothetical protein
MIFFALLAFSRACGAVSWAGVRGGGIRKGFREFWKQAAVALAWAFVVVFLWHCLWITSTYPSPLARYSPFRRDLDPWNRSRLGADFDDLLCQ